VARETVKDFIVNESEMFGRFEELSLRVLWNGRYNNRKD
jgi:hypothetical protein